jgi:prephenate dehydrogenase
MTIVAILGTGLIGCSIGLNLKKIYKSDSKKPSDLVIRGFDKYGDVLKKAKSVGAIDKIISSPSEAIADADLIILATPILAMKPLIEEISENISSKSIITDTGSTKSEIHNWMNEYLPDHTGFVGSHPMAGKTDTGPEAASEDLFAGGRWVVSPRVNSSEAAIATVQNLAKQCGATAMTMDPDEHDSYVAAISHLPMMAATALFSVVRASEAWPELSLLAAGGFRDTTRLAASDRDMSYDITSTNAANIVHWINRYIAGLAELRDRIDYGDAMNEDLYKLIAATQWEYDLFRKGKVGREEKGLSDTRDMEPGMLDFLAGGWVREKLTQLNKDAEDRSTQSDLERLQRRDI